MKVVIVGHHARTRWIAEQVKHLDVIGVVMDAHDKGARWGHCQALQLAATLNERVVIMEDDAIPVKGFALRAKQWCEEFPDDLLSFYLGTSRPKQWLNIVEHGITEAALYNEDYIRVPTLIHAVCYSIPCEQVARVLEGITLPEADTAIGAAWGKPVVYPVESLVEHRDGPPVERHPDGEPRTEPRVARFLAAPLAYSR